MMLRRTILLATVAATVLLPSSTSAQHTLDAITGGVTSVDIRDMIEFDGQLFVSTNDWDGAATSGIELWKSDGTNDGTVRVADIRPGSDGSLPADFTIVGSELFFSADDGTHGRELWKTSGTVGTTDMVRDIRAIGSGSSVPSHLVSMGGELFFTASGYDPGPPIAQHGTELWKSDGPEAGTVLVKDIRPGPDGSFPDQLTVIGDKLVFQANDNVTGEELWVSDGTAAGTMKLSAFNQTGFSSVVTQLTAVGGTLFFTAFGPAGKELYTSTGTGVALVEDLSPGATSTAFVSLSAGNGVLYFVATVDANRALWTSNGTPEGTNILLDLAPGSTADQYSPAIDVNGTMYFTADDGTTGSRLWKSDGTPGGTMEVAPIDAALNVGVGRFGETDDRFLFTAFAVGIGTEMFKTDGTPAGTGLYRDLGPGFSESVPTNYYTVGDKIFFTASIDFVRELWVTDVPVGCVSLPAATDGTYDFGPDTAVDIVFSGLGGSCSVTAERFDEAPTEPTGVAEIHIGDYYWAIGAPTCTFDAGTEIRFDLDELPDGGGFIDQTAINVYKRSSGETDFTEVPSVSYDAATNEIVVSGLTGFSEFVFASDASVSVEHQTLRDGYRVGVLYPNPTHGSARVEVTVADEQRVSVSVFDVNGRKVTTAFDGRLRAGEAGTVEVNGAVLAAGTYVVIVRGESFVASRSLVLVK